VRVRFFFFAREAAGASSIRHSLRPHSFEGARISCKPRARGVARTKTLATSLRANGSRECAPDDRLREAIQNLFVTQLWIASSQALLAMTGLAVWIWNSAGR
jgi:hypothetical protein